MRKRKFPGQSKLLIKFYNHRKTHLPALQEISWSVKTAYQFDLSTERHFSVETYPNDVIFLTSGLIENEKKEISWSVKTAYQIL